MPCYKLGIRFNRRDMVNRFLESKRTGFYVAVVREGEVRLNSPTGRKAESRSRTLCQLGAGTIIIGVSPVKVQRARKVRLTRIWSQLKSGVHCGTRPGQPSTCPISLLVEIIVGLGQLAIRE
jgi:hypothetical protein